MLELVEHLNFVSNGLWLSIHRILRHFSCKLEKVVVYWSLFFLSIFCLNLIVRILIWISAWQRSAYNLSD